jgi:hypothetical protein
MNGLPLRLCLFAPLRYICFENDSAEGLTNDTPL